MKKENHIIFNTIMTAACLLFLICIGLSLVLWIPELYVLDCKILKIPETSGYSLEVCKRNYFALIDYNMIWGPSKLVFPDFIQSYEGEFHFMEVKRIFVTMQLTALITFPILVIGMLRMRKNHACEWLRNTIILAVIVVAVIGSGLIFDWDGTFVTMHHILFSNDFWIFYPDRDPVINILPDGVFLHAAIVILGVVILGLIVCGILYGKLKKKYK